MAVGSCVVDVTSLSSDGDTLTPASGVIWKILSCGTSLEDTNLSLQIQRVSDGNDMRLAQKGASDKGQWAILCANVAAATDAFTSAQIPLIIDDTTALRLSGNAGVSSLVYVSYVIIEE